MKNFVSIIFIISYIGILTYSSQYLDGFVIEEPEYDGYRIYRCANENFGIRNQQDILKQFIFCYKLEWLNLNRFSYYNNPEDFN